MAELALWSRDISERGDAFELLRRVIEQRQQILAAQITLLVGQRP